MAMGGCTHMRGCMLCVLMFVCLSMHACWGQAVCGPTPNVFYYNFSTAPCTTSCNFSNPAIWTSSNASLQLPDEYSSVVMIGDPDADTNIFIKTSTKIGCLSLTSVSLYIVDATDVTLNYDFYSNDSSVYIEGMSSLRTSWQSGYSGFANIVDESYITVGNTSIFQIGQDLANAFSMDQTCTLQIVADGQVIINTQNANLGGDIFTSEESLLNVSEVALLAPSTSYFLGTVIFDAVEIPPNENITFDGGLTVLNTAYVDAGAEVYVYGSAMFSGVLLLTNNATVSLNSLTSGFANIIGYGTVMVEQSNVTLTSGGMAFKGQIVIVPSDSYIVLNNMTLQNLVIPASTDPVGSFTIVASSLNLASNPLTVPGNVTVSGNTIITTSLHVTGNLEITDGTLWITNSGLQVDQSLILDTPGDSGQTQLFVATGTINAPTVLMNSGSLLSVTSGLTSIKCDTLSSSGSLHIRDDSLLFINGTFISAAGALVRVEQLESHTDPRIDVTGSIYLMDGTIEYSFAGTPEKDNPYLVMRAGASLSGTDAGSYPVDITGATKASFIFKDNSMFILYESKVKHGHSMPWYGWFLIVLGILSIGGFVYLYYRRRTIYRRYQSI